MLNAHAVDLLFRFPFYRSVDCEEEATVAISIARDRDYCTASVLVTVLCIVLCMYIVQYIM